MSTNSKILIVAAGYGWLRGTRLALAGQAVHLVCWPAEADLINKEGAIVRMPVKGREGLVEINSKKLPGKMSAGGTAGVNPSDYHLVALAMQEPQYRSPGVRELLAAGAKARVPCMSIMNIPPLPYLKRIPGHAAGRQLSLRAEGRHAPHQGRRAQRPASLALCIQLGGEAVRVPGRKRKGAGAVRKIRERRALAPDPVLCGAGSRQRRPQHRAHRPPGADHRGAEGHALA